MSGELALFLRPVVSICFFAFHMRLLSIFYARAESNFFYMSFIGSWSSEKLKEFANLSVFTAVAMKNHRPHSKCNLPDKLFQSTAVIWYFYSLSDNKQQEIKMKGPKPYRESNCKTTSFADKKRNKEKQKCKTISTTSAKSKQKWKPS